jgi:hypothetical protein
VASPLFEGTSGDVCRFEMIWRSSDGTLRVNEVGPAGETCLAPSTGSDCSTKVDRVDFRNAGVTTAQRDAALQRIASGNGDSSIATTLFHGSIFDVTVRDHRSGLTWTEKRYVVDSVYFAPTARTHARSYYFMFGSTAQSAYGIGIGCRQIPASVVLSWAPGVNGPSGVLDDVIVTGTGTGTWPGPAYLVADQYFVHQKALLLQPSLLEQ